MRYTVGQKVKVLDKTVAMRKESSGAWKQIQAQGGCGYVRRSQGEEEHTVAVGARKIGEHGIFHESDITLWNDSLKGVEEL